MLCLWKDRIWVGAGAKESQVLLVWVKVCFFDPDNGAGDPHESAYQRQRHPQTIFHIKGFL